MSAPASARTRVVDVVGIGETMAVVTPAADESLEHAALCRLSLGGAESNVLVQLARSGVRTRYVTRVGADPLGRRTLRVLGDAGVDVSRVQVDALRPTAVYLKDRGRSRAPVRYFRDGSAAAALDADALETLGLHEAGMLYFSGITPALSPATAGLVDAAVAAARAHDVAVCFDVNYRPALWAPQRAADHLLRLARAADLVFVGRDEAATLWHTGAAQEVRDLLGAWAGRLIVKDGSVGATEFHAADTTFVPTPPVTVVEEVGAGDAFAAGYLSAWFAGLPTTARLSRGHDQAAMALAAVTDLPDGARP